MKNLETIRKELLGKEIDEVIEIFEDYNYKGISSIVVSKVGANVYQVYADHKDSPITNIILKDEKIIDAY